MLASKTLSSPVAIYCAEKNNFYSYKLFRNICKENKYESQFCTGTFLAAEIE